MSRRLAWLLLSTCVGFACAGKKKFASDAPIESIDQMCCAKGDAESGRFGGCVVTDRACREETPLWIRGTISCGAIDEANCLGARCCQFGERWGSDDAELDWNPPDEAFPAAPENADDEPAAASP